MAISVQRAHNRRPLGSTRRSVKKCLGEPRRAGAAPQDQRETAPSASLHGSSRATFEMMLTKAKEGQGKHECGRLGPNPGELPPEQIKRCHISNIDVGLGAKPRY